LYVIIIIVIIITNNMLYAVTSSRDVSYLCVIRRFLQPSYALWFTDEQKLRSGTVRYSPEWLLFEQASCRRRIHILWSKCCPRNERKWLNTYSILFHILKTSEHFRQQERRHLISTVMERDPVHDLYIASY